MDPTRGDGTLRPGRRTVLCGLVAALALGLPGTVRAADGARRQVDRLNATLLDVMQRADALGFEGRQAVLAPVLDAVFDFAAMIRFAVGRARWNKLDEGEQADLIAAFAGFSHATYAARFDGYSGQSFVVDGERAGPRGALIVETRIDKAGETEAEIDYVAIDRGDDWRVVDVVFNRQISEMSRRRSEFGGVVQRGGAPALLEELARATAALTP